MLSTKEITKVYKGTKITSRVDLYKTIKRRVKKQSTGAGSSVSKIRNLRNFTGYENPAKFSLSSPLLQHFCSKFPLVRSCIFEFGSGSLCLNQIEGNEAFDLQKC